MGTSLPCKAKRQYLLTFKVSRYCFLALHRSIALHTLPFNNGLVQKYSCFQKLSFIRAKTWIGTRFLVRCDESSTWNMWNVAPRRPTLITRPLVLVYKYLSTEAINVSKDYKGREVWTSKLSSSAYYTTRRSPNVELMLAHRLRRWANINSTLDQGLVFIG